MSQNEMILDHLTKIGSITSMQALAKFDCFRLGARIHNLRSFGHDILTIQVNNGHKRFAKYMLKRDKNFS